jgi:hypothetical protein
LGAVPSVDDQDDAVKATVAASFQRIAKPPISDGARADAGRTVRAVLNKIQPVAAKVDAAEIRVSTAPQGAYGDWRRTGAEEARFDISRPFLTLIL